MLIIDGDYPMAYGGLALNRDLTLPLDQVRDAESDDTNVPFACLPEMRKGGIAVALAKFTARRLVEGSVLPGYRSPEAIYGDASGQVAYYEALDRSEEIRLISSGPELTHLLKLWQEASNKDVLPVGMILGMEGADPILWPEQVHEWWRRGVRVLSLTHYGPGTYAHGTGSTGGLQSNAGDLLHEMTQCGMMLDMTHISDGGFYGALDLFDGPVLASHQNCRALVAGERQFTDDQIKRIIERDGVIGISMDTWMLYPDSGLNWAAAISTRRRDVFPRKAITLEHVADHILHVCELSGNSRHAAIGGDTDGQGGLDGAPYDIDSVADYGRLDAILTARGFSPEDVANVLYGNWQRYYTEKLPDQPKEQLQKQ